MDNLRFDKKSTVLGQLTTVEDSNKSSLELKQDDKIENTEIMNNNPSEILQDVIRQEVKIGNDDQNVPKQKLEDTITETDNESTLDVLEQKEPLGIDITIESNVLEVALYEEIESTVLPTDLFIIENEDEQELLTIEQTMTSMDTPNETHAGIIECMVGLKSGDLLVQKEALGIDINIRNNSTEDAIKEDIIIQNTHIENNYEPTQEVSTMEQPQTSQGIQIETNDGVVDQAVGLKSSLPETRTILKNAMSESKVPKTTSKIIQNALVGGVEKLDISEKIVNRQNVSEVIVKNKSQSLKNLLVYSDEDESDNDESNDVDKINDKKVTVSSSDSESDSDSDSSSDSESVESVDSSSESEIEYSKKNTATSNMTSKTTEGHYIADLPHVADLSKLEVDYEKEEFSHIGEISGIIDTIVTITTISGTPVYDLGSILFIEEDAAKKPLGEIYDVIGPVASPVYCIGFKSAKEIKELGIKPNMKVYSAPNSNLSHYVFLKQLLEAKHTDASELTDEELSSDEYISDSGDERIPQKRKFPASSKNDSEHQRKGNARGRGRQTMKHHNYRNHQVGPKEFNGWHAQTAGGGRQQTSFASNFSGVRASFNPSVPPPLFQNNTGWITPPSAQPPPSWNNVQSSSGPKHWITPPNLRTPPPQWNSNPSFNGITNMPPPPPHWNSSPRLGFPPNIRPPQRFAGHQQNYRDNYPANPYATAPPRWQPRTHPYQPVRYGSGFPNTPPPMNGSDQSLNYPAKDVQ